MELIVGQNRNAHSVFRATVPMTDHRWRGFCECGAPKDNLCRLDEERMEAVVARFRAWAYAYVRVTEVRLVLSAGGKVGGMEADSWSLLAASNVRCIKQESRECE